MANSMKTAFLFPGQGAQYVGMGADLLQNTPSATVWFERANRIAGFDVKRYCVEGPEEKLNSTEVSQPAIFVHSAILLDLARQKRPDLQPDVTAGLSMGEYSALYAAGWVSFEEGLKLVLERGRAMQAAADASEGAMVSILGLDEPKVRQICQQASEGELLEPVNFNCPGQIVISGAVNACRRAEKLAEQAGAMKVVPLAVAGAFHTSMMQPAARHLRQILDKTPIQPSDNVKIIANITAQYYTDAQDVREGLTQQLVSPILWQKCIERLVSDGVEIFYEIGPGRVLTGLMKRINRRANIVNISSWETLQSL